MRPMSRPGSALRAWASTSARTRARPSSVRAYRTAAETTASTAAIVPPTTNTSTRSTRHPRRRAAMSERLPDRDVVGDAVVGVGVAVAQAVDPHAEPGARHAHGRLVLE